MPPILPPQRPEVPPPTSEWCGGNPENLWRDAAAAPVSCSPRRKMSASSRCGRAIVPALLGRLRPRLCGRNRRRQSNQRALDRARQTGGELRAARRRVQLREFELKLGAFVSCPSPRGSACASNRYCLRAAPPPRCDAAVPQHTLNAALWVRSGPGAESSSLGTSSTGSTRGSFLGWLL